MRGMIGKIKGLFPVTLANAVYVDGTNKTLADAMKEGSLGEIGKSATIKDNIYVDYDIVTIGGSRRAEHDCTVIGNDIVSFNKNQGDGNGGIYYTDLVTMSTPLVKYHNFVEGNGAILEMKSVDYKYNKLLVGNGKATYNPEYGRLYVFYEADAWKASEIGTTSNRITFETCGEYKEIDVTSLGGKTYGFWGNGNDIVFVTANLFNDIYRIQLAKGTTQWEGGTFAENTASDKYNGTWQILNHWHQDGALGAQSPHGGQYYKGHLYLADNHGAKNTVYRCIFRDNGALEFQPLNLDRRASDGTMLYWNPDGVCIHDGKMYVQPLQHHSSVYGAVDLVFDIPV